MGYVPATTLLRVNHGPRHEVESGSGFLLNTETGEFVSSAKVKEKQSNLPLEKVNLAVHGTQE
jgi:hypothetical protein